MADREYGIPSTLRAGVGSGSEGSPSASSANTFIQTSMGLLKVFSEEAVKTAGECALAQGRAHVCHEDMRKALKYQARMFFQQVQDVQGRVDQAARELMENAADSDQEDDCESDGESEDGEEAGGAASDSDESAGETEAEAEAGAEAEAHDDDETDSVFTSYSSSSASTVDASRLASSVVAAALAPEAAPAEASGDEAELMRCRATARRVDAIVASWDHYEPTDPVLAMIKNAIDATDRCDPRAQGDASLRSQGRLSKRKRV